VFGNDASIHIKKLSNLRLCQLDILITQKNLNLHLAVWRGVKQKLCKAVLFCDLFILFHNFIPEFCTKFDANAPMSCEAL
jgi:hypothetical protein